MAFRQSRRAFRYIFARFGFLLAQKNPVVRGPKSEVQSPSLAKDAAPIPNALGNGNGDVFTHRIIINP